MRLLSVRDAGAYLCLSEVTIRRLIKRGVLAHVKLNKSIRVPLDAVIALIQANTSEAQ